MTTMKLALVSVLFTLTNAQFFVVQHSSPLVSTSLDPIVNPGGLAGHQHAVVGSDAFGPTYDYETTQVSNCTTANVDIDRSSYWVPDMYRKTADGKYKLMGLSHARTYYLARKQHNEPIYSFPKGFRMVAGDASSTTYDENDNAQKAIGYICWRSGGQAGPRLPNEPCAWGLRSEVFFPNCWDGKNNWLEGSKHVAYPAEGNFDGGGKCPDTHPKRIPSLFYEMFYHDFDEGEEYVPNSRVLANGDDLGRSLHGDFTNGWPDNSFLSDVFATCGNVGDSIENCPLLKPHMKQGGCPYNGLVVEGDTKVGDVVDQLPGNNPLFGQNGPRKTNANYVESRSFVQVSDENNKITPPGPGKAYAQVNAGDVYINSASGDDSYAGPTFSAGNGATVGAGAGNVPAPTTSSAAASGSASASASGSAAHSVPTAIASGSENSVEGVSSSSGSTSGSGTTSATATASTASSSHSVPGVAPVLIATDSLSPGGGAGSTTLSSMPTGNAESGRHCKRSRRSRRGW